MYQADSENKADESCNQKECEAYNLGDQLGRLTVDDLAQSAQVAEVEQPLVALVIGPLLTHFPSKHVLILCLMR